MRVGSRVVGWSPCLLALVAGACASTDDPVRTTEAEATSTSDVSSTSGPPPADVTGSSTTASDEDTGSTSTGADSTSTGADSACGNGIVEDGETCDDAGESLRCNDDCTATACGDGIVNAAAGEECDGMGETAACDVDCTVAACGDGIVNAAAEEACDDAAETAGCDVDCTPATCGDGTINLTADEECDDGGESAACDVDCTVAACGDGVFNATAGELCDAGGATPACDADCTLVECGDGFVNAAGGEACDDAGESATCNSDCSPAVCGDGITNATAGETCDDMDESLSCDSDCSLAACGDGLTNATAGEACDDMGESLSCDSDCSLAVCGDGLTNATAGEACDDTTETAGCDPDCTLPTCGDEYANPTAGELCDGGDLAGASCVGLGFVGGALACAPGCTAVDAEGCGHLPGIPVLTLGLSPVKQLDFSWDPIAGATHYRIEESVAPGEPFVQLGSDVAGTSLSVTTPLHLRHGARYRLRACDLTGCIGSAPVSLVGSLAEAVGYVKASNPDADDQLGWSIALSEDGSTLAVGAHQEDSSATDIDGDQADDSASTSGAVYVFVRDGAGEWSQQAYIKASNAGSGDSFGRHVALSADGSTLAVGARAEDGGSAGVGGDPQSNAIADSGAAYVFVRDGLGAWSQQAYIKASNPDVNDWFGWDVALSDDGSTLAVGAYAEDGGSAGIDGDQQSNATLNAGAAYVFVRDGLGAWSQQAYVKASNPGWSDQFGYALALSSDGSTLAVGTQFEDSGATGIDGDQADDFANASGAVYVFVRDGLGAWSQQAYVKASNTDPGDYFGWAVALAGDGNTLAVGAYGEDSGATGIGGDQANDDLPASGAVYVLVRDGAGEWSHQAYVKASTTDTLEFFGDRVALSTDGNTLAVGAFREDGNATGIAGDPTDDSLEDSGAAYVFVRDGMGAWSQRAYVKASNRDQGDGFGQDLALSGDAHTLAVGAVYEDGGASGIAGDQADESAPNAGAVYLF